MVSIIALIMVILMVLSLIAVAIPSAYAIDQSDIDALQAQKQLLSKQVQDCRERLAALNEQQANVLEQKNALMEENRLAQEQLDLVQKQIDIYEAIIAEQAEAVKAAKGREDLQLQKYRTRVRAMEENGSYNILTLMLRVGNLSDLLAAVDDMGEIMESDKVLEEQYIEAREESEELKAEYEAVKQEYEGKETVLLEEQAQLKEQMNETNRILDELAEDIEKAIAEYQAAEAAEAAASAEITATIAEWNRQKAAAAAAAATVEIQTVTREVVAPDGTLTTVTEEVAVEVPAEPSVSGTGSFVWPVPCSMRVTSRYGNRADPFTGATAYHSGIDIDGFGNDGAPIVAADGGYVITAATNSGYGNYVIIDHGSTKTVYAHMSGFAVSAGQSVTQGQTIGYLGATGRATGTHCHFEVYVGDSRVDPAAYFSGISYYNC